MEETVIKVLSFAFPILAIGGGIVSAILQILRENRTTKEAKEAEDAAFKKDNNEIITMSELFKLYSKQIQKYQEQTRSRASWSFALAIICMLAGLGFVFWGGSIMLSKEGWEKASIGASMSAIGGAVSAYITKTFLDVHKLSLIQLNRYFRQPVLNDHILMAQRLADELEEPGSKQRAYEEIIHNISKLINEESSPKIEEASIGKPDLIS